MTKSRFSLSHCIAVNILEDSGQPLALATLGLVSNEQEDGWAPEPTEMLGEEINLLALVQIIPQFLSCLAHTLVTIPTMSSKLWPSTKTWHKNEVHLCSNHLNTFVNSLSLTLSLSLYIHTHTHTHTHIYIYEKVVT